MRYKAPKKVREINLDEMLDLRRQGITLREIGERLGISRQRVQQLLGKTRDIIPHRVVLSEADRQYKKKIDAIRGFWERVNIGSPDECWNWQGTVHPISGYGQASFHAKTYLAHRLAYILTFGEIPEGLKVLHSCDNPACCNFNHLRAGTQAENIQERDVRQRRKAKTGNKEFYSQRKEYLAANYRNLKDAKRIAEKWGVCPQNVYMMRQRMTLGKTATSEGN